MTGGSQLRDVHEHRDGGLRLCGASERRAISSLLMIDFEEARRIAIGHIPSDYVLMDECTIEKPYGWRFLAETRAFLETGGPLDSAIGFGDFLVERESGRIFDFYSAYSLEENFANYEKGFRYHNYDLVIEAIFDLDETVRLLKTLNMSDVEPEIEWGTVWVIPKHYTCEQIRRMLDALPCTFESQGFNHRVWVFDMIDASACCRYHVREHIEVA